MQIYLEIIFTTIYSSLHCRFEDDQPIVIDGSFVNDLLRAETEEWQTGSNAAIERFEKTGNELLPFTFAGIHITEVEDALHSD